jgi:hypothetical protein
MRILLGCWPKLRVTTQSPSTVGLIMAARMVDLNDRDHH